jgi:RNA polymerase binding protein RbpA
MAGRGRIVGSGLGATSYEGDRPATTAVNRARYVCTDGHLTDVPFSTEATDLPAVWDCARCGARALADGLDPTAVAQAVDGAATAARGGKPVTKTPWDHVLERRSIPELEVILAERLAVLRGTLRATA